MSLQDEILALRKKRKQEEEKPTIEAPLFVNKTGALFTNEAPVATKKTTSKTTTTTTTKKEPVVEEKEDERKWFEKGEFEDGYQFGDVFKTILGTARDVKENVSAGILGMGEKTVDALATIAPYVAKGQFYQNGGAYQSLEQQKLFNDSIDAGKESISAFVAKDLYDEEKVAKKILDYTSPSAVLERQMGVDAETSSVLGEKSDALVQSAGQLGTTVGLSAMGVPWFLTTGVTSYGGEAESALREGATLEEANLSAAISAGAEILTEKLSGGIKFGGKALDDVLVKRIASGISNKTVRTMAKLGLDAAGEGTEEIVSQVFSNLGSALYKEKSLEELLTSEEAIDEYIESFIGGAVLGGGMSTINAVSSGKQGIDAVTGLNQQEQAVVEKIYNDRLAEEEKTGKLTQKQKSKIYDEVLSDMDKGYISTDSIEEILGGETYHEYQRAVNSEESLKRQFDALNQMKQGEMTGEQIDLRNELKQQMEEMKSENKRSQVQTKLRDEVFGLVQNSRLAESYNERGRKSQAFEADLTQYDAKYHDTIKKAAESGILNNTRRTHEFVDMIAKISADKGVLFDFTNNEKLKTSGFAVDGKTVNGYVTKDGVTLNIDSAKSLNSVTGHEITHVLEGTELYTELQKVVFEYAKSKGEYQSRYDSLSKLYANVKDADIDAELTADLVGDYIFSDTDFVNNLSVNNRNVFQKIYDEIKYLCKVATAGSKEARELEKVKRAFEKAYKEGGKTEGTKYSLTDSDGKQLSKGQQEYFKDSKMRDENGNLKVMYHGTEHGGFHVFDARMSDDDISFFFVDSPEVAESYSGTSETYAARTFNTPKEMNRFLAEIGYEDYEVVKEGGKYTLYYDTDDAIATSDNLREIYEEFCDFAGVGEGEVNYKVYLNLTNPLVVDAEGNDWNGLPGISDKAKYDYIKIVNVGDAAGQVTIEYAMDGDNAPTTEIVDLYKKFPEGLAEALSDMAPGESVEGVYANPATTREYAQYAKEQGYDGVVFKNIYDIGAYGGNGATEATVAIAFSSEQIKSVANDKPTADKDIRFSLSEEVEQTDRLVAVHNKSVSGVMRMLERGGVPFPSVAIKKAGTPHEGFGECSIVFPRSTIDPEESRWNKLYSNDAWTPTEPRTEYDVGDTYKIKTLFENMVGSDVYHALRSSSHLDSDELAKELKHTSGNIFDAVKRLGVVKYGYLQSIGQRPETGTKQKTLDGFGKYKNDQLLAVFDAVGGEAIRNANYDSAETLQQIADALNEQFMEQIPADKKDSVFKMFAKKPIYTADNINIYSIKDAYEAWENAGRTIPTEIDYYSLENALRDNRAIEEDADYQRWVEGIFDGIIQDSGIPNGKDFYTPSGNRRSFKQLHVPATLENIVQQMRKENETGIGAIGGINLRGAATKTYDTVEDMRAESGKLLGERIDDDVYDSYMNGFHERLNGLSSRAAKGEGWQSKETAEEILLEAVRDAKTKAAMNTMLRKEAQWINYDVELVSDLWQLKQDVQNMPAPYFEAKPRRIVSPYEAAAYIIPDNAPAKLIAALNNKGLPYKTYKAGDEADRLNKLNGLLEEQPDLKFSLSEEGEVPKGRGVFGKDIALATPETHGLSPLDKFKYEEVAPVGVAENATATFPDDLAPVEVELERLYDERTALENQVQEAIAAQSQEDFEAINSRWLEVTARIEELERDGTDRTASLSDEDAPPEVAPYIPTAADEEFLHPAGEDAEPFEDRDIKDVGDRSVKAYMYENPEVKPFFQHEALVMLTELDASQKGERWFNWGEYAGVGGRYGSDSNYIVGGVKRDTSHDIAYLLDNVPNTSYDKIRAALNAIVEDNGRENNALSKRIEFILDERLRKGYENYGYPGRTEANQEYIDLVNRIESDKGAFDALVEHGDEYAPVAATTEESTVVAPVKDIAPVMDAAPIKPEKQKTEPKVAKVLTEEPKVSKEKPGVWAMFKNNVLDKGMVFEDLALKTGDRELQARWNSIRYADARAQRFMEKGNASTSSLDSIRKAVESTGKTQQFYEYLYHLHNADRMTLEDRYEDTENKPVFGYDVTADISKQTAASLEKANPEFKQYAEDVYGYMNNLREMLVDGGVISRETANLWAEMYPHYVPVRRVGDEGLNINVALDTKRTGVNAPIKRATGGNRDILPLFDTMAQRTLQTYKAIAKNRFGVELKNILGTTIDNEAMGVDEAIEGVNDGELLKEGKDGRNPTFTVFENGERVTFEITEEMYRAMKPTSEGLAYTNKVLNKANNIRRGLITEYNPAFMLTNPIKDAQDVLINSQHPAKTYANFPKAIAELWGKNGHWYNEYMENGGEQNTYFEKDTNTFAKEKSGIAKVVGFPLEKISDANNFIERIPRMAEYIASRKEGRSIDVAMLDSARVTTNFAAGGDLTKLANRNGFTFLNASVQGAVQQVRNVREAKANGLKGWAQLAGKIAVAGLPSILLNHLLWDDDEEYAELSDYVKQNYYIVGKYGDGKFVRIPKGRALAVIQNAFEQMENAVTGNDEVDLRTFGELVVSNLAPNNPLDNNIIAPIGQALNNRTWYGEDLVPSRLQDLPAAEQYDESTDSVSKWLGEKLNVSPYKINYLLDQYSGGVGDMLLPMLTTEAESGDNSFLGNMIAPIKSKFTTDSVMNNQNVSDFYDTKDELNVKANASGATDEDVLRAKYMNSVSADFAKLYAAKREIQNSDMPDDEKYEAVRDIQKQIDMGMEDALNAYGEISYEEDYREGGKYARVGGSKMYKLDDEGEWQKLSAEQVTKYEVTKAAGDSNYATDGENHYRWYVPGEDAGEDAEAGWRKVTDKEYERQQEVTNALDISPEEYWSNREEYAYAYDNPESYAVAKAVGGYEAYRTYSGELYDIKADKDKWGQSISGSRKEKVREYINNLDADYYTKIILWKSEYNSDDSHNMEIIDYLNGREDISYEDMEAILLKLGFKVDSNGNISW